MKHFIKLLLLVACTMAVASCNSSAPDYENLSKEELMKLDNDGEMSKPHCS